MLYAAHFRILYYGKVCVIMGEHVISHLRFTNFPSRFCVPEADCKKINPMRLTSSFLWARGQLQNVKSYAMHARRQDCSQITPIRFTTFPPCPVSCCVCDGCWQKRQRTKPIVHFLLSHYFQLHLNAKPFQRHRIKRENILRYITQIKSQLKDLFKLISDLASLAMNKTVFQSRAFIWALIATEVSNL